MTMSENLPTNVQLDNNQNGSVTFATEVVATIAGLAATEVEGVASMVGSSGGLADILTRRGQGSRNLTKGVKVEVQDGKVSVHVAIIIDYGSPVPEVAHDIQENVKKAVETMSGLSVASVDVHVQGISFDRENRAAAEIEMQQRVLLQKREAKDEAELSPEPTPEPEPIPPAKPARGRAKRKGETDAQDGAQQDAPLGAQARVVPEDVPFSVDMPEEPVPAGVPDPVDDPEFVPDMQEAVKPPLEEASPEEGFEGYMV